MKIKFMILILFFGKGTASFGDCIRGGLFGLLPGDYRSEIKIQEKILQDELKIKNITKHQGMASLSERFDFEYIIPNAVTQSIGRGYVTMINSSLDQMGVGFSILVTENKKTVPVYFKFIADVDNTCEIHGAAFLDQYFLESLGVVRLINKSKECKCGN